MEERPTYDINSLPVEIVAEILDRLEDVDYVRAIETKLFHDAKNETMHFHRVDESIKRKLRQKRQEETKQTVNEVLQSVGGMFAGHPMENMFANIMGNSMFANFITDAMDKLQDRIDKDKPTPSPDELVGLMGNVSELTEHLFGNNQPTPSPDELMGLADDVSELKEHLFGNNNNLPAELTEPTEPTPETE